jgi:hypothetical protein
MVFLAAGVGIVAVAVLFNLSLSFAIVRRLRLERSSAASGGSTVKSDRLPPAGKLVGEFRVLTADDNELTQEEISRGKTLVAFVMPGCPPCQEFKEDIAKRLDVLQRVDRALFLVQGEGEAAQAVVDSFSPLGDVALITPDHEIHDAFGGMIGFPGLVVLARGVVVAAGYRLSDVSAGLVGEPLLRPLTAAP